MADYLTLSQRATDAIQVGNQAKAYKAVVKILREYPDDISGWYFASKLDIEPAKQLYALERVLALQPTHRLALERRSQLYAQYPSLEPDVIFAIPVRDHAARGLITGSTGTGLAWFILTFLGLMGFWIESVLPQRDVPKDFSAIIVIVLFFARFGGALIVGQWFIFRKNFGAGFGSFMLNGVAWYGGLFISVAFALDRTRIYKNDVFLFLAILSLLSGGFFIGLMQWLIVRRYLLRAWRWIPVTTIGYAGSILIGFAGDHILAKRILFRPDFLLTGLISSTIFATITGLMLVRMLEQRKNSQSTILK